VSTKRIPVVLLMPRGEGGVKGGFPFACNGSIIKPIDPEELLSTARSLLGA